MDVLFLSRLQFALSIGIHFLFPVTSLGLAFFIVLNEGFFLKTGQEIHRRISRLAVGILAFVFALGVATGIIMPFAFGTNWSNFVSFANSVFGIHLTIEVVVAFMLESIFLGVLLFGRDRVGRKLYFFSALMVLIGSHFSAFLIISANSWMQTPFHSLETLAAGIPRAEIDGFHMVTMADGTSKLVLDDVGKVIFNPTAVLRFLHTITACWLCGAIVMGAISGWHLRKNPDSPTAGRTLSVAVAIGLATAVAQPVLGHAHIMEVLKWQPAKNAAMEGIYKTDTFVPLYGLGWVDEANHTTYGIGIPGGLSFFETLDFNGEVKGLDDVLAEGRAEPNANPAGNWKSLAPPVQPIFQLFRVMVMAGVLMIVGLALAAFWLLRKKAVKPWLGMMMVLMAPLPYLAVEGGWITAEIGRQPWIIFGLLPTSAGVSLVPVEYVGFSLVVLCIVWITLGVLVVRWLPRIVRRGMDSEFETRSASAEKEEV